MSTADLKMTVVERGAVPPPLKRFLWDIQSMVELTDSEREILFIGRDLTTRLLGDDDWLPAAFAKAEAGQGAQFQLFNDVLDRFTVVATVLPPGASLLIDQSSHWEIAGGVSGAVFRQPYDPDAPAQAEARPLRPREVETRASCAAQPMILSNPGEQVAVSLHVYGGDIKKLSRRARSGEGAADSAPLGYANGDGAPPYDIFSIQSDIVD
jgi:predicted metal-dependent enzyme (double-stranded beta helix superfamily)